MDDFVSSFIEEVRELLVQLEDNLINLEQDPHNQEIINTIFRIMHTLKGSAGMVGFRNIQDLTHEFENIYEQIRKGSVTADDKIIDLTLKAKDLILKMLNNKGKDIQDNDFLDLVRQKSGSIRNIEHPASKTLSAGMPSSVNLFVIIFSPFKGIFERGIDPDKTLEELKCAGDTFITAHHKKSWEKQKAEKTCQTTWEIYFRTSLNLNEVEDIFLFYDRKEYHVFGILHDSELEPDLAHELSKLYKKDSNPEQKVKSGFNNLQASEKIPATENNAEEIKTPVTETTRSDADATITVSSHKLDELMNLVSELVTLTATMEVKTSKFNDPGINNTLESIEKLTKKFRNNALDLRLVPVGSLLNKFKRQVRDLSKDLGKKVNLLIEGQDIEIDKSILRAIESPLQHIIRNSIDHGLETEEARIAKGKTPEGLLKLTAFYSGSSVILQIQDDGTGINLDRVREVAILKGYLQFDQPASKEDLISLIMEPGFTTNENVSLVSGRGVGMDVVRKELNGVGGSLEVFTEKDLGTSITMKLPTTLTIVDTLMVNIAETKVLIPVTDIEYCYRENRKMLSKRDNRYVEYKNQPIPLVSLREQFNYSTSTSENQMVLVINKFERKYALIADEIVGEFQAVIKPLGELFVNQPYFSGGSILVDGDLAFILDTNFLFNHITKLKN